MTRFGGNLVLAKIFPYADPPFNAVEIHCNRCNKTMGKGEKFLTQQARDVDARQKGGEWVFCDGCDAKFEQESHAIEQQLQALRERQTEEFESTRKRLWAEVLEPAKPSRPRARSSTATPKGQPSTAPKGGKRRGGASIPNPADMNG